MGFLKEIGFSKEEILQVENNTTEIILNDSLESKELVLHNIKFLKDYGIENYKEVYIKYNEMFLMDPSKFSNIFTKYEREDLIEKIKKNVSIVELL